MKCPRSHRGGQLAAAVAGICLAASLLLVAATTADGPVVAFGPQDYERGFGFPRWEVDTFSRPQPDLNYVLRIENGGSEDQFRRVRFAFIKLNGRLIVGPWDFRGRPEVVERAVTLQEVNRLKVLLLGRRVGFTVTVLGLPAATVPDVVGLTESEAAAVLAAAGLSTGDLSESLSLVVPAGLVVAQDPAAGTSASPGSEVDLELAGTPADATPIPASWVGLWQFTVSYTDPDSGSQVAEEVVEGALCPGDVVGPVVINQAAGGEGSPLSPGSFCSVDVSDSLLAVYCDAEVVFDADCFVDAIVSLTGTVQGDDLVASGEWSTVAIGACTPLPPASGEDIAVTGIRVDPDPGVCDPPRSSLTQQLVRHPNLLLLGIGGELEP